MFSSTTFPFSKAVSASLPTLSLPSVWTGWNFGIDKMSSGISKSRSQFNSEACSSICSKSYEVRMRTRCFLADVLCIRLPPLEWMDSIMPFVPLLKVHMYVSQSFVQAIYFCQCNHLLWCPSPLGYLTGMWVSGKENKNLNTIAPPEQNVKQSVLPDLPFKYVYNVSKNSYYITCIVFHIIKLSS